MRRSTGLSCRYRWVLAIALPVTVACTTQGGPTAPTLLNDTAAPLVLSTWEATDASRQTWHVHPSEEAPEDFPLAGNVSASGAGTPIAGATITVLDGADAGRTTTTNTSGGYRFDGLRTGNANLSATATGYEESRAGVYIDGTNSLDFELRPLPATNPTTDSVTIAGLTPPSGSTLAAFATGGRLSGAATVRYSLASRDTAFVCVQPLFASASANGTCSPQAVTRGSGTTTIPFAVQASGINLPVTTTRLAIWLSSSSGAAFGTGIFLEVFEAATFTWTRPATTQPGPPPGTPPSDGSWTSSGRGTSSASTPAWVELNFEVAGGIMRTRHFQYAVETVPGTRHTSWCGGKYLLGDIRIENGSFVYTSDDGYSVRITGTFTSKDTVRGTAEFFRSGGAAPPWCQSATINWTGTRK